MRSARSPLLVTVILVIALVTFAAFHKHAITLGTESMRDRLCTTNIDLACEGLTPESACQLIHQKLIEKDPFFQSCRFELYCSGNTAPINLSLKDAPASECLKYVTELSMLHYDVRPRMAIVAPLHVYPDHRDRIERATDAITNGFDKIHRWVRRKLGLDPPYYPDPFAPSMRGACLPGKGASLHG